MHRTLLISLVLGLVVAARPVGAQQPARSRPQTAPRLPGAVSVEEATLITNGWALLAQGLYLQAATKAAQVLAAYPRSGAALLLAIEAELARGGAAAGLGQYERWLRQRTLEEPLVLRRVAHAVLREEAAQQQDQAARVEALSGLADEGESGAARELAAVASRSGGAATRTLASLGDERAVRTLVAELGRGSGDPVSTLDALGASGSPLAIAPAVERLKDPRQEVRGAAAEGLGKLGDTRLVAALTPMLSDRSAYVRVKAAGALLRLGDDTGMALLQDMIADPSPTIRIAAAGAMASRPDASWIALVRELTAALEPEVRAAAGRLIAPYDPELSRTVLESLSTNENPAIRELASRTLGEVVTNDLTMLRSLMRSSDRLTRVRGAARLMALTR